MRANIGYSMLLLTLLPFGAIACDGGVMSSGPSRTALKAVASLAQSTMLEMEADGRYASVTSKERDTVISSFAEMEDLIGNSSSLRNLTMKKKAALLAAQDRINSILAVAAKREPLPLHAASDEAIAASR